MATDIDIMLQLAKVHIRNAMAKLVDLTGSIFGRLEVVSRDGSTKHHSAIWKCKCECGTEKSIDGQALRKGLTQSCGCLGAERRLQANTRHGMYGTTEYRIWADMLQRCNNPKQESYEGYGARGISVCKAWHEFSSFYADMGERPEGKTLDRIDNEGNYEPSNCRWSTGSEQAFNQRIRRDNSSGTRGISRNKALGKWETYLFVRGKKYNLGYHKHLSDAIEARKAAELRYI